MSQSTKNKKNKTANCLNAKANEALITLVTRFSKEFIDNSFDDVHQMFLDWVGTHHADDCEKRESFAYSIEIMLQMGKVVKSFPTEMFDKFSDEANAEIQNEMHKVGKTF